MFAIFFATFWCNKWIIIITAAVKSVSKQTSQWFWMTETLMSYNLSSPAELLSTQSTLLCLECHVLLANMRTKRPWTSQARSTKAAGPNSLQLRRRVTVIQSMYCRLIGFLQHEKIIITRSRSSARPDIGQLIPLFTDYFWAFKLIIISINHIAWVLVFDNDKSVIFAVTDIQHFISSVHYMLEMSTSSTYQDSRSQESTKCDGASRTSESLTPCLLNVLEADILSTWCKDDVTFDDFWDNTTRGVVGNYSVIN